MCALSPDSWFQNLFETSVPSQDVPHVDGDCHIPSESDRISQAGTSHVTEYQSDVATVTDHNRLSRNENIPKETQAQILSMAVENQWGYVVIAKNICLNDGRKIPRSRVESFLISHNLDTKAQRKLAAEGVNPQTLPAYQSSTIPRVRSFLRVDDFETQEHCLSATASAEIGTPPPIESTQTENPDAASGENSLSLGSHEKIPEEIKAQILTIAIEEQCGSHIIAKKVLLSDGRKIPASHVESFLFSQNLNTKAQRELAALGLHALPLPSNAPIPEEMKARILSMTKADLSPAKIAGSLRLKDGKQISTSRVRSFLRKEKLDTKARRLSAAANAEINPLAPLEAIQKLANDVELPLTRPARNTALDPVKHIPEELKAQILSMAIKHKWGATIIAKKLRLSNDRKIAPSQVDSFLSSQNLDTKAQRESAALGLAAPPLSSTQPIPKEMKLRILSMAILNNFGSRKIAGCLHLEDGKPIPANRVRLFLRKNELETKAQRAKAAAALDPGTLPCFQPIPDEIEKQILYMASRDQWDAVKILENVRLPDERKIPIERVQSFLDSSALGTSSQRAIAALCASPAIFSPNEISPERSNYSLPAAVLPKLDA